MTWARNDHPWLSEDGLTIYWDRTVHGKGSILSARRESSQSAFTDQRQLFNGRCPTVSSDGLEMVFVRDRTDGQKGRSLFATSREAPDKPFRPPAEITELSQPNVWGPCLSPDGLKLYFNGSPPSTASVVYSARSDRASPWSDPKVFADLDVSCPSLTADHLRLLGHDSNAFKNHDFHDGNFVIWSRVSASGPFETSRHITCPASPSWLAVVLATLPILMNFSLPDCT